MLNFNYQKKNKGFEAAEILTTGYCPLNCRYCYIPKTSMMKDLHQEIIRRLKDNSYLDNLEKIAGNKIHYLGLWGTEPALTLDILKDKLPEVHRRFRELKVISFSTSMMFPESIRNFAKALSKYDIKLNVQVSLDGPAFIVDENRFKGASKKIPQNFFRLVSDLQNTSSKINFCWKSTFTLENIREMSSNSKINEFFSYFEKLNKKFREINKNPNINLDEESYSPTLAVPGKYTSEDGKKFAIFLKKFHQKNHHTTYTWRLLRIVEFQNELSSRRSMFTCSGGDSQIGVGERYHICHRTFYLNNERYVKSVLEQSKIENWDVSLFKKGSIDLLKKWYIPKIGDKKEEIRFRYVMRNYHDFWRFQMAYVKAMMTELALVGQAENRFLKDDNYLTLFALFVNTGFSCPVEAILNTGCIHLTPISILRILGNGAFQEIFEDFQKIYQKKQEVIENNKVISYSQKQVVSKQQEAQFSKITFSPISSLNKTQNPKIYFYNWNVGSGIERAGNTFLGMLEGYRKEHPENIKEYKMQNPCCILIEDLVKFNPDVIIMNEYYPRLVEACYYYKSFKKDTKIILLNHCYDNLVNLPISRKLSDADVTVNYAFRDTIDQIINLNYRPKNMPYPSFIKDKTIDRYFTLRDDKWNIKTPFSKRKKDFLYIGNLLPHKFSSEFVDKFSKTSMKIDIYGKMFKEKKELKDYNDKILKSKNFNYLGYCSPEKVVDIYNKYRFLILPHHGYEPFSFVVLEALKTGTIPLITETSSDQKKDWLTWADGLYIKHDTVDELLNRMEWYLANKRKLNIVKELAKKSKFISEEINLRTNYKKFQENFFQLIF
jgi:sulfatase maturation enzyme AslB (radical SAM superfamily)/glycosyltransferase involved in cell wall biosynthesis